MLLEPRQPIISQRSSVVQNWLQENCPGCTDTLQAWIHWTSTSGLSCLGCHAGKVPSSSRSLRRLMSWKPPCRLWEELQQEHINKAVANFIKHLTAYTWLSLPMAVTSSICSNSVHLKFCILLWSPQQTGSLQSHQQITVKDNTRNNEKWG